MRYMYPWAELPPDTALKTTINAAAERIFSKISRLNIDKLDIADYTRVYLRKYQNKLRQYLQRYTYELSWAVYDSGKPIQQLTVIDFGAGVGVMTLLVKECGFKRVIYNDIYDVSCRDAAVIGRANDAAADEYVCGDLDGLIAHCNAHNISCDILLSCDVIEHIYNLQDFFSKLPKLPQRELVISFSTHANIRNPITSRFLMNKQREIENVSRPPKSGHKERDTLQSYIEIRKKILGEALTMPITEEALSTLARLTRGQNNEDIRKSAAVYEASRQWPTLPEHPTNTCDPLTGNWADRLLEPAKYLQLLNENGFTARLRCCYYGQPKSAAKRFVAGFLDIGIRSLGEGGVWLAPYFAIQGKSGSR